MADQANRKLPPTQTDHAADDPLMELSRIVGFDEDLDAEVKTDAAEAAEPPTPDALAPTKTDNRPEASETGRPGDVSGERVEPSLEPASEPDFESFEAAPDVNLDLEDALMAELGEPETAPPAAHDNWSGDVAPSDHGGVASSPDEPVAAPELSPAFDTPLNSDNLEDELTAILDETPQAATPANEPPQEIALPSFDTYLSESDEAEAVVERAQPIGNGAMPEEPAATTDPVAAQPERPARQAEPELPDDLLDEADFASAIAEDQAGDQPAEMADDAGLESVFQDVFDAALDDTPAPSDPPAQAVADTVETAPAEADPVEELAAIMGISPAEAGANTASATSQKATDAAADPDDIDASLAGLDAIFDEAVEQGFAERQDEFARRQAADLPTPPTMPMSVDEPPVVDTVEIGAAGTDGPTTIDVPDLPPEVVANAEPTPADQPQGASTANTADAKVAAAASVFAAAGTPVRAADPEAGFDESDFEAELARDMEFVGHDMQAARNDADSNFFDDEAFDEPAEDQARGNRGGGWRGLAIGGVLGLIALAGVGAVMMIGRGGKEVAGPVLVEAGDEPVKIVPDDPGGQTVPNQDRAVFDEGAQTPSQETLVTTTEEPVDIAVAPTDGLPSALEADGKSEERLTEGGTESAPAAGDDVETITPRRVRTLIVRPDGTLEERPVPPEPQQIAVAPEAVPIAPNEPAPAATPDAETSGASPDAGTDEGGLADRFGQTVADQPGDAPQAAGTTEPEAPQTETPVAASSGFTVQLAALPSEAEARSTATSLSQRYGNLIAGRGVSIQRAVIEGRGTFYRVRVAANGRDDANTLCNQIQAAGGNCFVAR